MTIYLYIGLLDRLLTKIKFSIESDRITVNNAALNMITFDIEKLQNIVDDSEKSSPIGEENKMLICQDLLRLYNVLYEKVKLLFQDNDSTIRKTYVIDIYTQIRAKLLEVILLSDETRLKI